jgi:serine protease Do
VNSKKGNNLSTILSLLLIVSIGGGLYFYKKIQSELKKLSFKQEALQSPVKNLLEIQEAKKKKEEKFFSQSNTVFLSKTGWIDVQKNAKDTVVQVHAQVTQFNWLEPYKTPKQGEATGSGFFINKKGDIVTNYHIVSEASNVQIQIPTFGMERFDVDVVGVSPERDIALLKITKESFERINKKINPIPFLNLGDSDLIMRTQEVLALGYPLGQTRLKSTLGIVSGRERIGFFGYIQVTTPLNPGNSGGPALNTEGKVIGINSRGILSAQNVGYIIPINEVKSALKDIYNIQLLRKPMLGCIFTMATYEMIKYFGNPEPGGWYIAKVFDNSLLKGIDVKEDDMLYAINGHSIDMYGELNVSWSEDKVTLFELLNRYKIGDTLNFSIYRKGKPMEFSFKLTDKYLPPIRVIYPEFESNAIKYEIIGGVVVMELSLNHVNLLIQGNSDLVKYGSPENQHKRSLIITHIFPNSQAYKARVLRPGGVIEQVNDKEIKTLDDFRAAVLLSKNNDYLTIKTIDKMFAVLSVKKILKDEKTLSSRFFYPISTLIEELQKKEESVG